MSCEYERNLGTMADPTLAVPGRDKEGFNGSISSRGTELSRGQSSRAELRSIELMIRRLPISEPKSPKIMEKQYLR